MKNVGIVFYYVPGIFGNPVKQFVDYTDDAVYFMSQVKKDTELRKSLKSLEKENGELYLWALGTAFRLSF